MLTPGTCPVVFRAGNSAEALFGMSSILLWPVLWVCLHGRSDVRYTSRQPVKPLSIELERMKQDHQPDLDLLVCNDFLLDVHLNFGTSEVIFRFCPSELAHLLDDLNLSSWNRNRSR